MENIYLAIVTDNKDYGRALGLAMLSVCRRFIINISSKEEFFNKPHSFDLVLWDGKEAGDIYGGKLVSLAERPSDVVKNITGRKFCIYKYSAADHIVAAIFEIYETITGRRAVNLKRQNVRLFGFASCAGGTGCTSLAAAVGQELCRFKGKRVLYMSFEELESTGNFIQCPVGLKGIGVYLYNLFKDDKKWDEAKISENKGRPFLDAYMVRDDYGMYAFAPTQGRNPLRGLSAPEIYEVISSVIDSGKFDVILMDIGSWISKTGIACLEMAERICWVTSYKTDHVREEQYIGHLVSLCGESILEKFIRTVNMVPDKEKNLIVKEESSLVEKHMNISRSKSILKNGDIRRLQIEGEFGSEISMLTDILAEPFDEDFEDFRHV